MNDLKPCPFCGNTGSFTISYSARDHAWTVSCKGCLSSGALADTLAEAVESWNRRAKI